MQHGPSRLDQSIRIRLIGSVGVLHGAAVHTAHGALMHEVQHPVGGPIGLPGCRGMLSENVRVTCRGADAGTTQTITAQWPPRQRWRLGFATGADARIAQA